MIPAIYNWHPCRVCGLPVPAGTGNMHRECAEERHAAAVEDADEELYCSECGAELEFDDCPECGGEGFREHEPDSEEPWTGFETCNYCGGHGTFQRCPNARHHSGTGGAGRA